MSEFFKAAKQYQAPQKLKYFILTHGENIIYAGTEKKEGTWEIDNESYRKIILAGKENLIFSNGNITNKQIKLRVLEQELVKSQTGGHVLLDMNPFWIETADKTYGDTYKWQTPSE
jgi:hypothetical protein